jgi:hypothetical protein
MAQSMVVQFELGATEDQVLLGNAEADAYRLVTMKCGGDGFA